MDTLTSSIAAHLDRILERLRTTPLDRSLERIEREIRGKIIRRREVDRAVSALAILRPFAVGIALIVGAAAGGVVATLGPIAAEPVRTSIAGQLPSSLLENAR